MKRRIGERGRRRLVTYLLLSLYLLTSAQVGAQNSEFLRYRVAVLEFDVIDLTDDRTAPEGTGIEMAAAFETTLGQSRRFVVITRLNLEKILDELALGPTGILNPDQVQAFGEIAGVNIIITGIVTAFSESSYGISARFIDVATGEIVDTASLRVTSLEEFSVAAEYFVERALVRFPLQGNVFAIDDSGVYVNVGIIHGLTPSENSGVIFRPREIAGRSIPLRIGTFTVQQAYPEATAILPIMEDGYEVEVGDLVTIQTVAGPAMTDPVGEPDEAEASDTHADEPQGEREPTTTSVYFDIEPVHAKLTIDGDPFADWLVHVAPGSHAYRVEATGYEPHEGTFEARSDRVELITVELVPRTESDEAEPTPPVDQVSRPSFERAYLEVTTPVGTTVIVLRADGDTTEFRPLSRTPARLEVLAGALHVTLIAPVGLGSDDGRPKAQQFDLVLGPDDEASIVASAYLQVDQLADGDTLLVWRGDDLVATFGSDVPAGVHPVPPGTLRIELARGADTFQLTEMALDPWELAELPLPAAASDEERAEAATPPITQADPVTSVPSVEVADPVVVPVGHGVLSLSSNVSGASVVLDGPITIDVEVGTEAVELPLPDGIYLVTANKTGLRSIDEVAFVTAGESNELSLDFDLPELTASVGSFREDQWVHTLIVLENPEPLAGLTLEVSGPPGWNGNKTAAFDVNEHEPFYVVRGPYPVDGQYSITLGEMLQQAGPQATAVNALSSAAELKGATGLIVEQGAGSDLWARWNPVPDAQAYFLTFHNGTSVGSVTVRSPVTDTRVPPYALTAGSILRWCVTALNWAPGLSEVAARIDPPQAVETCTVSRVPDSTSPSNRGNSRTPSRTDDGGEETPGWTPKPKPVDP